MDKHGDGPPTRRQVDAIERAGHHAGAIEAEQVDLLYRQTPTSLSATVFNAVLLAGGLWASISLAALGAWLSAICAVSFGRYRLFRRYVASGPPVRSVARWKRHFLVGVACNGLLWGIASSSFFVTESYPHQTLLAFVLAGMSAGAVSTLAPLRGAALIFLIPALIPYTVSAVIAGGTVHWLMGGMVILFVAMMWVISNRLHQSVFESLRLRFENVDLVDHLRRARDLQDFARQELTQEVEAKRWAQRALQESYVELEHRVDLRTRELEESTDRLAMEKELFRITLASIGDGVITADREDRVTYLNPSAEQVTGWRSHEAEGMPLDAVFRVAQRTSQPNEPGESADSVRVAGAVSNGNLILMDRQGVQRHVHLTAAPISDQQCGTVGTVLTFRDITEERTLALQLSHQATHDPLTGLVNRREFERRLDRLLHSDARSKPHALIFLDLDRFKVVNDTCGHVAGDELLRQISILMRTRIRTRDTFARLGGDEFGVLLEHCPPAEAIGVAQSLRELVQDFRFGWQGKSFIIGVSIGLVEISDVFENSSSVLRAADSACYVAKDRGRNRVYVYEPDDRVVAQRFGEMQWMPRVQHALADGRMRLYWQAILPTRPVDQRCELAEVLVRLLDEQRAVVLPGAFLPAAERYGQMTAIDRWVLGETCKVLETRGQGQKEIILSVNLSGQSLSDEEFLDFVFDRIRSSRILPSSLCFEITETAAISNLTSALAFINSLKELGCRFSLDDFGSGLSSFGYLKNLPVDYLKIDGRFVKEIVNDPVDETMVEVIQRLAHVMGLKTIAEWVEDEDTLEKLAAMEVDYAQGFHVATPRPI